MSSGSNNSSKAATIWSTRVKKEIHALEERESLEMSILPSFVRMDSHTVDLEKGICTVTFRVDVEKPKFVAVKTKTEETVGEEDGGGGTKHEEDDGVEDAAATEEKPSEETENKATENENESEEADKKETAPASEEDTFEDTEQDKTKHIVSEDDNKDTAPTTEEGTSEATENNKESEGENSTESAQATKQEKEGSGETEDENNKDETNDNEMASSATEEEKEESTYALFTLDVSMETDSEGVLLESSHNNYPFQKPRAILTKGTIFFSPPSPMKDGEMIEVDCDWTPSLHLVDAALNVGLRIHESIRKGDPTGVQLLQFLEDEEEVEIEEDESL